MRCCHRSHRSTDARMSLAERPARLLTARFPPPRRENEEGPFFRDLPYLPNPLESSCRSYLELTWSHPTIRLVLDGGWS